MGDDGLTDIQQAQLDELLSKIKLTDAQAIRRDHLQQKSNTIELSRGAKTLIEEYINREYYGYGALATKVAAGAYKWMVA